MNRFVRNISLFLTVLLLSLIFVLPTMAAESGGGGSGTPTINVLTTLDIANPNSMTVNDRKSITITLKDQNGKDFYVGDNLTIYLNTRNYWEGAFYAKPFADTISWWDDYEQGPIGAVTVAKGAYQVTVWYQPYSNIPSDSKNVLYFGFINGDGNYENIQATIETIRPAGDSYITSYSESDNWPQFVSDASNPKTVKVSFTIKDQYGNDQSSNEQKELPLYTQEEVKLFADAECKIPVTKLVFPVNAVSASVYAISEKSGYFGIWTKIDGAAYESGEGVYFKSEKADKLTLLTPNGDSTRVGNYIPLKIEATDKFGNETYYFDYKLTALLSSNIGHFYNSDNHLITQASVQTTDDFNGYYWWDNVYFKSDEAGSAAITASVPGINVISTTVKVEEPTLNFNLFPYSNDYECDENDNIIWNARPEWRVPLYPVFENQFGNYEEDYNNLSVSYQAYVIQNGIEKPVGVFYDGYNSGNVINKTNLNSYYEDNQIYFEVPAELTSGTKIYIKATPDLYPELAKVITLVVKTIPDFTSNLDRGWNIISTPFALTNNNLLNIIDKPDYVQVAYGFKDGKWYQMKASNVDSMKVNPLESYYVKVRGGVSTSYLSLTTPTAPPTRTLAKGWNLISAGIDTNYASGMYAKDAFNTVTSNSSILLSPALNQPAWSAVNWQSNPKVYAGLGYWIYMNDSDELAGFSTTPVTNPGAYTRYWGDTAK